MNSISVANTRAFALMGHSASGKTTLVDALLFKLGVTDRMGGVSAGTSMADYTNEERNRKITIYAKPFSVPYRRSGDSVALTILDTPGYLDFYGQVIMAARAVETGLVVVDAAAGVQVGTRRAWQVCGEHRLARAIVVTGLDRENAQFMRCLGQLQQAFGVRCLPVTFPGPDGTIQSALKFPRPAEAEDMATRLAEVAAETDDALIEKFLGGDPLSPEEMFTGLRRAMNQGVWVPVFACTALQDRGLSELLEGIAALFPSPVDRPATDDSGQPIDPSPAAPFVGFVWRTVNDAFVGQLTFVRILGGTLRPDSEVINVGRDQKERIGALVRLNGKKQEPVEAATAGDIVAIPKLKVTMTGDTLAAPGLKRRCPPFRFPNPVVFQAVHAKTQADEDKIGTAVARLVEEDPTYQVIRNTETKELVLAGLGDGHIDVAVERMKARNVDVVLTTPKVPYRETVTARGEGHYKHKKQTGGRGQYGEVYLRVEPKRPDDPEWFVDAIVGGVIPGNFIPAVQKGLLEGMKAGCLAGYPVTDVKITVHDGSYHEVDSSEISFKIAAARALKDGLIQAKPVLLEPIMKVRVMIPDAYLGDVTGDLNHKRGRILGMENEGGMQVITAEVPQAELFRYAAELRSMTGGQGTFEMELSRYDIVPAHVAQKVIAEAAKERKGEEED